MSEPPGAEEPGKGYARGIDLLTIGFTRTSAESFFTRLTRSRVRAVVDVRLNNTSQLAGFAKAGDLVYFLKTIGNIEYRHEKLLAPTQDILTEYKKNKGDWRVYEQQFLDLMAARRIESVLDPADFDHACLLCSEPARVFDLPTTTGLRCPSASPSIANSRPRPGPFRVSLRSTWRSAR